MLGLDDNEQVLMEVRKHWFVLMPTITILLLLAIAPAILSSLIGHYVPINFKDLGISAGTFFYMLWLLCLWAYYFVIWTGYYLDVWFITEKRIISIDQIGLFHRKISNLSLDKIQDISIEQSGMMQSALKFGDIVVKTAAEGEQGFVLKDAADPDKVRETIFSHHVYEHEKAKPVVLVGENDAVPKNLPSDFSANNSL